MALSAKQIVIFNLINGSEGFINCAEAAITKSTGLNTAAQTALTAITGDPPDTWSSQDVLDVIAQLETLEGSLDDFLIHTNRISGKTFSTGGSSNKPDFAALAGIANVS